MADAGRRNGRGKVTCGPREGSDRVLVVTGAYPPDVCGVGDYTSRLTAAAPASWEPFVERDWSPAAAPAILRRLLGRRPSRVVVQYPTQGYGWSLVPHLLVAFGGMTGRYRPVLVLHEFTSLSRKAQLSLTLAARFASRVVFTTEAERDRARAHRMFPTRVPCPVIPILSNIPATEDPPPFSGRTVDLAYFGHLRPNKGLEEFLDVAAEAGRADPSLSIAAIGQVPEGYEEFAAAVRARCREIGCGMREGLDDAAAARSLADVRILYLPFRDGVSAKRGSVLAGLANGALVATRIGDATPEALRPAVIACPGGTSDAALLLDALRLSDAEAGALQRAGRNYVSTALPRDWEHVAELYEAAMADDPQCRETRPC